MKKRLKKFWITFGIISILFVIGILLYKHFSHPALALGTCAWYDIPCKYQNMVQTIAIIAFMVSLMVTYSLTGKFFQQAGLRWLFAIILSGLVGYLIYTNFILGIVLLIGYIVIQSFMASINPMSMIKQV
jgi:hypothetical protein